MALSNLNKCLLFRYVAILVISIFIPLNLFLIKQTKDYEAQRLAINTEAQELRVHLIYIPDTRVTRFHFFNAQVDSLLRQPLAPGEFHIFGVLDGDHFGLINSRLGSDAVDKIITTLTKQFASYFGEHGYYIGKLSEHSDELYFLRTYQTDCKSVNDDLQHFLYRFSHTDIPYNHGICHATCTVGLTIFPDPAADIYQLYAQSDFAVRWAKEHDHRNSFFYYFPHLEEEFPPNALEGIAPHN